MVLNSHSQPTPCCIPKKLKRHSNFPQQLQPHVKRFIKKYSTQFAHQFHKTKPHGVHKFASRNKLQSKMLKLPSPQLIKCQVPHKVHKTYSKVVMIIDRAFMLGMNPSNQLQSTTSSVLEIGKCGTAQRSNMSNSNLQEPQQYQHPRNDRIGSLNLIWVNGSLT